MGCRAGLHRFHMLYEGLSPPILSTTHPRDIQQDLEGSQQLLTLPRHQAQLTTPTVRNHRRHSLHNQLLRRLHLRPHLQLPTHRSLLEKLLPDLQTRLPLHRHANPQPDPGRPQRHLRLLLRRASHGHALETRGHATPEMGSQRRLQPGTSRRRRGHREDVLS